MLKDKEWVKYSGEYRILITKRNCPEALSVVKTKAPKEEVISLIIYNPDVPVSCV